MSTLLSKNEVVRILSLADVAVGGKRAWDIQVHDERFYGRVLRHGSLGLGESYVDGWWDAQALDQFFFRILAAELDKKAMKGWRAALFFLRSSLLNPQTRSRAFIIGKHHYDLGNDLFQAMLDRRLTYSCGYWKDAATLNEAQEAKLDLICRKLRLSPGLKVLDIGCGWGSFVKYAAEKFGVRAVGITVSRNQSQLATELCKGLPVEIRLQDYRDVDETFDRIVSVGMFEHVGYKNYRTFMDVAHRALKADGLFLLHTIGSNISVQHGDPWTERYIFPNSMVPSVKQISEASEGFFVVEDWHSFGADYDKTLMAWFGNFDAAWCELKSSYDERFYRMWKYYLLSSAGSFRARKNQLWQIVLSPKGVEGGYVRER